MSKGHNIRMTRPRENPVIWRQVGGRIRHFRRSLGMSVATLAEKVDVTPPQIVRIEAGLVGTTLERLHLIADALNVSEVDLLPPRRSSDGGDVEIAFRGHGLSDEEIARVMEYVRLIKGSSKKD